MKKLVFIVFFVLACETALAGKWLHKDNVSSSVNYWSQQVCEAAHGSGNCVDFTGKDIRYHSLQVVQEDDPTKPIYQDAYNVQACDDVVDCGQKLDAIEDKIAYCDSDAESQIRIKENNLMPGMSLYCTKVLGYEKKAVSKAVEDAALRTQVLAEDQAKAVREQKLAKIREAMSFGRIIKQEISLINLERGLSEVQVTSFVNTFAEIDRLLEAGAIATAREKINGLTPDEDLLRAQDKTLIISKIDAYLAKQ